MKSLSDTGRINRTTFCLSLVVCALLPIFMMWLNAFLGPRFLNINEDLATVIDILMSLAVGFTLLLLFFTAEVKRLHDTGNTGLWVLLNLIPFAGALLWLYLLFAKGSANPNAYGPPPR